MFILTNQKKWIVVVLVFVILVFMALNALFFRNAARDILQNEEIVFLGRVASVELLTESTSSAVMMLNQQIQFSLENQDSFEFSGFEFLPGWNEYYETWRLNVTRKKIDMFGNRLPENFTSDDWKEIQLIRHLSGMLDVINHQNNLAYFYYLSDKHFAIIAPPPPQLKSEEFEQIYEYPFWVEAIPENNLDCRMIVSSVYEDPGGLGEIITLSSPVMANGIFRGITCMDISLGILHRSLAHGSCFGKTSVYDENFQGIISNSKMILHTAREKNNFFGKFGKNYNLKERQFVFNQYLLNQQLLIQHTVPLSLLLRKAFLKIFSTILNLLALIVMVFLLFRLNRLLYQSRDETVFVRRLIRIIGHDLQTPLSVSLQALEMMETEYIPEAATLAKQSLSSASALLRDLSFWGKSRTSEIKMNKMSYPITTVVEQAVNPVLSASEMKQIVIELQLEEAMVELDQNIFLTIVRNLVSNAVKFTPISGTVMIFGQPGEKGGYTLLIKDSGIGMREDQIHDFLNNKTLNSEVGTRGEKGTGIGLNLVRSLCSQAGWSVTVESVPNEGTTFIISIPD